MNKSSCYGQQASASVSAAYGGGEALARGPVFGRDARWQPWLPIKNVQDVTDDDNGLPARVSESSDRDDDARG